MSRNRNPRLTAQIHQQIIATIRAGGYPHIAAQARGVPAPLFEEWLERGTGPSAREPYRPLARDVLEAHAQARLKAEVHVLQEEPKVWLEHGPGRERPDRRGWSTAVKPVSADAAAVNALMQQETREVLRFVLEILSPYPDAR